MRWTVLILGWSSGCIASPVHMFLHHPCEPDDVSAWPEVEAPAVHPAGLLDPFDVDVDDYAGPGSSVYGKTPEVVTIADPVGLDVLLQDYGEGAKARLLRIEQGPQGFVLTRIVEVDTLDRIMGLARDEEGFLYVASGVEEGHLLTAAYPALGEYREDIVHIDKLTPEGELVYRVDLDIARSETGVAPELVINPMVAATSRLAYGDGTVALLHGINTDPDPAIGNARHQKALTTHIDAATGEVTRTSSIWVSHSFDQRLYFDGQGFVEMHLGDAYPRWVTMARIGGDDESGAYPLYQNKGTTGDNNTWSRLGAIALIPPDVDPDYGYLAVFSTDRGPEMDATASKNIGLVRVKRDFETEDPMSGDHLDPDAPDQITVPVDGSNVTNALQWLTDYNLGSYRHAERPTIVSVGCDAYVVLWEEWDLAANEHLGTYGITLDSQGEVLVPRTKVTDHHIPRGDDVIEIDNSAGWVSADKATGAIHVNRVYADLTFSRDTLE